jgi:hypothetical protein
VGISTLEALKCVVDYSTGGPVGKDLVKRRLEKAYRKGRLVEEVNNPEWQWRLGAARLMLGDWSWQDWEHRSDWARMLWYRPDAFGIPRWNGRPVGRLLVLGEQGLGDEVMFASCLGDVKAEVDYLCEARLMGLFERSFGIRCFPREIGQELSAARKLIADRGHDAYIGSGDLPRLFRHKDSDFPQRSWLVPDPSRLVEMEPYRGMVGISWRGRNGQYPLKDFPRGLSLQYNLNWDEEVETPHIDLKDDIEGIVALISVLSRVVTVSTSVAHFAGALGVPTDVVLAPMGTGTTDNQINWRWQDGRKKKVPWYSSVTVYRNLKAWASETT